MILHRSTENLDINTHPDVMNGLDDEQDLLNEEYISSEQLINTVQTQICTDY